MTGAVISPVVPSSGWRGHAGAPNSSASVTHRVLPLPTIPAGRARALIYGMAAVDSRGRVADQAVIRALGWAPGDRLDMREANSLLVIHADPHGLFAITSQGHLRLPADARHCAQLTPGDRVLLVADLAGRRLVVHPPTALDLIVTRLHTELLGGVQ